MSEDQKRADDPIDGTADDHTDGTAREQTDGTAPGQTDGTANDQPSDASASEPAPGDPTGGAVAHRPGDDESAEADVASPAKVMRIGTMVKQLLEEVRGTDLDEKGRERLAQIHRRSIDELEDGLSSDLVEELERLDLPFDSADGPPTTSELRIAQAQLVGWLEGLFHGIQTAIMAQQAMAKQGMQLPPGAVPPGAVAPGETGTAPGGEDSDDDKRRTGNYL